MACLSFSKIALDFGYFSWITKNLKKHQNVLRVTDVYYTIQSKANLTRTRNSVCNRGDETYTIAFCLFRHTAKIDKIPWHNDKIWYTYDIFTCVNLKWIRYAILNLKSKIRNIKAENCNKSSKKFITIHPFHCTEASKYLCHSPTRSKLITTNAKKTNFVFRGVHKCHFVHLEWETNVDPIIARPRNLSWKTWKYFCRSKIQY